MQQWMKSMITRWPGASQIALRAGYFAEANPNVMGIKVVYTTSQAPREIYLGLLRGGTGDWVNKC